MWFSAKRFVSRLVGQKVLRFFYLYLVMIPRVLFSEELRQQVSRQRQYFPEVKTKIRLIRNRNWGKDYSIAITPRLSVPIDDVLPSDHPEILAFLSGEPAISRLMDELAERGYSPDYLNARRELTPKLLRADLSELYSEASIQEDGRLKIHDGHHRAGVARALGDGYHNVVVSIKVNFE